MTNAFLVTTFMTLFCLFVIKVTLTRTFYDDGIFVTESSQQKNNDKKLLSVT
jgi:hypothetical protein